MAERSRGRELTRLRRKVCIGDANLVEGKGLSMLGQSGFATQALCKKGGGGGG